MKRPLRLPAAIAVFLGACAVSLTYALTSEPIFEWINAVFPSQETVSRQIEFLAFPLLLAATTMIWRRRFFGWQIGQTLEHWRLVVLIAILVGAAAVGLLTLLGATPYGKFPWPEWTLVPLAEEAVYRAIVLAGIMLLLTRAGFEKGSRQLVMLAVVINAVAFGVGHAGNFQYNPPLFTTLQIGYSTALGAVLAYSRLKTDSMLAPVGLHALVNFIATVT
jgi:membrane protease YdiL (CAAX protease family)